MSSSRPAALAACALALLLAGCGDGATEPTARTADLFDPPATIVLPDTARAGQPFVLRISTVGGGCDVAEPARVAVRDGGTVVEVNPLVTRRGSGAACGATGRPLQWDVPITFARAGDGTVLLLSANGLWARGVTVVP